jgi:carboxypeptidase Q
VFRLVFTASCLLVLVVVAAFARAVSPPAPSTAAAPGVLVGIPVAEWLDPHRANAERLIKEATADQFAWQRLAELTDTYGHRLSGSDNLTRAIAWAVEAMKKDGLENVRTEKVMVPQWIRGAESLEIVDPPRHEVPMLGLGGSIATPPDGIQADVIAVRSYDELNQRASEVKGKIVLYNVVYTNYGQTNQYRTGGASAAARHGAVASLVRSVGPVGLRTPHTGNMAYAEGVPRIPAAAIPAEDADRIHRLLDSGRRVRLHLRMEARFGADVESANVVGEIIGSELPDEVVLVGGHFDSWDVGTGASDDAVGCVVTWEAARLMKKLGIRPRRTVRVVLFTNEENGLRGAYAYRDAYLHQAAQHVLAIESDSGVFAPARLGFSGSEAAQRIMREIGTLLTPLGLQDIGPDGGGADIGPIAQAGKVPMLAYQGDSFRYFTIHHTPADTVDRITPEEVSRAAAALAVVTYVAADAAERLPR